MFTYASTVVPEIIAVSLLQPKGGAQGKGRVVGGSRQTLQEPSAVVATAGWPDPGVKHGGWAVISGSAGQALQARITGEGSLVLPRVLSGRWGSRKVYT